MFSLYTVAFPIVALAFNKGLRSSSLALCRSHHPLPHSWRLHLTLTRRLGKRQAPPEPTQTDEEATNRHFHLLTAAWNAAQPSPLGPRVVQPLRLAEPAAAHPGGQPHSALFLEETLN